MQSYADGNFLIANKLYCQGTLAPTKKLLLLLLNRFSRVQLCATPQTAAQQAPPSLGFSRQEYWSGLPFPSPTKELVVVKFCDLT